MKDSLSLMMFLNKDTRGLFLAALVVIAMLVSSCHAQEECHQISPCNDKICMAQCTQRLGYKNPKIRCIPANPRTQYYDTCCCQEQSLSSQLFL
ncbi:hypothetical protein ACP70R_007853 [Stipagrostis hirtigluma subsp. patula]